MIDAIPTDSHAFRTSECATRFLVVSKAKIVVCILVLSLCLHYFPIAIACPDENSKPELNQNYAAQLPRIPPKSPTEALKSFRLHPGFRIELVAAEPLVASPVAIDFDEDGRLYIAEFPEFNQSSSTTLQGKGRLRLLEDKDDDGVYEKSTIFLDMLESPTAVCCYDGGVFVGAAPDIFYAKDLNGDGRADIRRVVFTGFAKDALGEGLLNSFRWHFDNRIHVQTSFNGGSVRHAEKTDTKTVSVRGQGFAFDPHTESFELTSGGGQHGMSMDDWGRTFVNTNHKPVHMLMYDRRYLARNPYLDAPAPALEIAPGGYNTKVFRISPDEPWRVVRTRLRTTGVMDAHPTEGAEPSGFYTACSGLTVYRGDAWPAEYRGDVFVGEVANNLVFRARLDTNGIGAIARRADPDAEFLASTDIWHRPVQMANGPDGTLYLVDMYRHLIQGASILPPGILKHLDVGGGFDMGRIYRIEPDGFQRRKNPQLSKASTAELVALLEHENGWHRDTAMRLLYQKQDPSSVAPLKRLASKSNSPMARTLAMYVLDGMKSLDVTTIAERLRDLDSRVREHALRLAEPQASVPVIREQFLKMTADPDPRVRYQLAFSLGAIQGDAAVPALAQLAKLDGSDTWCRLALLSSVNANTGKVFRLLVENEEFRITSQGHLILCSMAMLIGSANRMHELADVDKGLDAIPDREQALVKEIVINLFAKLPNPGRDRIPGLDGGKAFTVFRDLLRDSLTTASDEQRLVADRVAAIRTLRHLAFAEIKSIVPLLLNFRQPQLVQAAAIDMLAKYDEPSVPNLILNAWPGLSPQLRSNAVEAIFSRSAWIVDFLDAVEQGKVKLSDVDLNRIKTLQSHADTRLRSRAAQLSGSTKLARRQDVVSAYQKTHEINGDSARGKALFKKECSACHQLEGVGTQIGADLNAMRNQGAETLLLNILDPNREVKPQFLSYSLLTVNGRTVSGMIAEESANSITIQRSDGTNESVLRSEIEELRSSQLSFMPEGLEKVIDVPAMADLLSYLVSLK